MQQKSRTCLGSWMCTVIVNVTGAELIIIISRFKCLVKFSQVDLVEEDHQRAVKKVIRQNMVSARNKTPTGYVSLADEIQTDYESWTEEMEKRQEANNSRSEKSSSNSLTFLQTIALCLLCNRRCTNHAPKNTDDKDFVSSRATVNLENGSLIEGTETIVVGDMSGS